PNPGRQGPSGKQQGSERPHLPNEGTPSAHPFKPVVKILRLRRKHEDDGRPTKPVESNQESTRCGIACHEDEAEQHVVGGEVGVRRPAQPKLEAIEEGGYRQREATSPSLRDLSVKGWQGRHGEPDVPDDRSTRQQPKRDSRELTTQVKDAQRRAGQTDSEARDRPSQNRSQGIGGRDKRPR